MTLWADDLEPGRRFAFGRHTMTREEIVDYAERWDPIAIHTDPDGARAQGLPDVIASGLHTLAVYQRFVVAALWNDLGGGVGRSFEIGFRRPVAPGTTLTGSATIASVEPRPGRGDAAVTVEGELRDEQDRVVLTIVNASVIPYRPDPA
jgi:acyl dehydratase